MDCTRNVILWSLAAVAFVRCLIVPTVSVYDIGCSFEDNTDSTCGWTSLNLTRSKYANSLATANKSGPRSAQDGEYYVYLNTVNQNHEDHFTGSLTSESVVLPQMSSRVCLIFWYHMFGETMGNLTVVINDTVVWTRSGNQSNAWHCGLVDIESTIRNGDMICFRAAMGMDIYSIIALDNIDVLNNVACKQSGDIMTGATCGAGDAHPSGTPDLTLGFCEECEQYGLSTTIDPTTLPGTTTAAPTVIIPTMKDTTVNNVVPTTPVVYVPPTTGTTQTSLDEYIPYMVAVPAVILVTGVIIVLVCLKRSKPTNVPDDDVPYVISPPDTEVYDTLDYDQMITDEHLEYAESRTDNQNSDYLYIHPDSTLCDHSSKAGPGDSEGGGTTVDPYYSNQINQAQAPDNNDYLTPSRHSKSADGGGSGYLQMNSLEQIQGSVVKTDNEDYLVMLNKGFSE